MTILLAPVAQSDGEKLAGGLFRKQILKTGTLDYKGRRLIFDREYFGKLSKAFAERAYDSVPFMLADSDNRHTMAPERAAGEVVALEATDQGLDAIIRLSETGRKIVADNSRFGVSARIVEGLERGDGYKAPAALQHVLGTWDPRVTGLSPWKAIGLSADTDQEVIDLTSGEESMPRTPEQEARLTKLLDLPDDAFEALLTGAPASKPADDDDMTEEEADAILAQLIAADEGDGEGAKDKELAGAALSNGKSQHEIELATLRAEQDDLRAELARDKWKAERALLASRGVPPKMLDLAAPVLELHKPAPIDLSNGTTLDPAKVIRDLLNEARGTIDLSGERAKVVFDPEGDGGEDELAELHKLADSDPAWK